MFDKLIADGIVAEVKHPTLPLRLLNYTRKCQFEKLWCQLSLQCRGLILHKEEVIAKPFPKFFNIEEHKEDEIPWHKPHEITEKLDGSLLIVFWFGGAWHAATRGSFTSEQATKGLQILKDKYGTDGLDRQVTYLFEVIYPQNRIVLDYGDREDVILIGMFHAEIGELNLNFAPPGLTIVRRLNETASLLNIKNIIKDDEEGYVVRFDNGFRVKVKGDKYIELHRIISDLSNRRIWEVLANGKDINEILETAPDEFDEWIRNEADTLLKRFRHMYKEAVDVAFWTKFGFQGRKNQAQYILTHYKQISSAVFLALDEKTNALCHLIWQKLYPEEREEARATLRNS